MKDFRQLKVWKKAHLLTLAAYRSTAKFPRQERFGLTGQIRRWSSYYAALNMGLLGVGRLLTALVHKVISDRQAA
jgi:23S rRNA-intervening sequence protein